MHLTFSGCKLAVFIDKFSKTIKICKLTQLITLVQLNNVFLILTKFPMNCESFLKTLSSTHFSPYSFKGVFFLFVFSSKM